MTAISRNMVKMWLVSAGTNPSSLVTTAVWTSSVTGGYIPGQIKSYTKSGGDVDVETVPVFGGYVDKEKAAAQIELELTIIPALENSLFNWQAIAASVDTTTTPVVYTSKNVSLTDRAFFIQAVDSTAGSESWAWNNCTVTVMDQEHDAEDNLMYTLRLKLSPTDSSGIPNYQTSKRAVTSLINWSSLTTS